MAELEQRARLIAAQKMGLVKDPDGARLPDDLWKQALPQAERELAQESLLSERDALAAENARLREALIWALAALGEEDGLPNDYDNLFRREMGVPEPPKTVGVVTTAEDRRQVAAYCERRRQWHDQYASAARALVESPR